MGSIVRAGRAALRAVADPVVWVFVLAGTFEVLTGDALLHATLLYVVAAVLVADAVRRRLRRQRATVAAAPLAAAAPAPASTPAPDAPAPASTPAPAAPTAPDSPAPAAEGQPPPLRLRGPRAVAPVAAGIAYAVVVGTFRRYTYPVTLAVGIPALAAVVWAWRTPTRRTIDRRLNPWGVAAWLAAFVGLGLWELIALSFQPALSVDSATHPTLSVLLDPILAHHLGRSVGLAIWLAIGWFLVER